MAKQYFGIKQCKGNNLTFAASATTMMSSAGRTNKVTGGGSLIYADCNNVLGQTITLKYPGNYTIYLWQGTTQPYGGSGSTAPRFTQLAPISSTYDSVNDEWTITFTPTQRWVCFTQTAWGAGTSYYAQVTFGNATASLTTPNPIWDRLNNSDQNIHRRGTASSWNQFRYVHYWNGSAWVNYITV